MRTKIRFDFEENGELVKSFPTAKQMFNFCVAYPYEGNDCFVVCYTPHSTAPRFVTTPKQFINQYKNGYVR